MSTPEFMHREDYFKAAGLKLLNIFDLTLIGEDDFY